MNTVGVTLSQSLAAVDWSALKAALAADDFDNGRSPAQLQQSFENSHSACFAIAEKQIVGTARVLSDGICNAYLVDVWTQTPYRRRGIARAIVEVLLAGLPGQHVYLQTDDDTLDFYEKLGFVPRPTGVERLVGAWLDNSPATGLSAKIQEKK